MKTYLAIGLLLLQATTATFANEQASLWQKSLERMHTNGLWLPGEVRVCEEVIDQTGNLQASECSDFKIKHGKSLDNIGVERLSRDSKSKSTDVDEAMMDLLHSLGLGVPYFSDPSQTTTTPRTQIREIDGKRVEGVDFRSRQGSETFTGTVWIEITTSNPVRIEMRLSQETPVKYKGMDVDHFYRTIELRERDGVVIADRLVAEAWVSSRSLFKRNLVVRKFTVDLKSHWKADF